MASDSQAKAIGFVILLGLFVIGWSMQKVDDMRASWAGFATTEEWKSARKEGFADPESWDAKKKLDAAEKARKDALAAAERARKEAVAAKNEEIERAVCRESVSCWANETMPDAGYPCQREIERLAKYEFEWDTGWFTLPFSRASWIDKKKGTILFVGDKVKFQNGFGAWRNYIYQCAFDTNSKTVISVGAQPGRL